MSFLKHFSIVAISIAAFSCSTPPEPTDNLESPEFYLEGTVNGEAIAIYAGDDDYYMYTGIAADANQITSIYGELSTTKCASCASSFRFEFRQPDSTNVIEPSEILKVGDANFWSSAYWEASFFPDVFGDNSSTNYLWKFGDTAISTVKYPRYRFAIEENVHSYGVCLIVDGSKEICNSIYLQSAPISADFNTNRYNASYCKAIIECRAKAQLTPTNNHLTFHWQSFLGGISIDERNITMIYPWNYPVPIDIITLTVSDAHQNSASYSKYVVIDPLNAEMTPNFNYEVKKIGTTDKEGFGKMELKYTDNSGKQYSTKFATNANEDNHFTIVKVEEYLPNEKGQPTKKVTFEYSGLLYTAMGAESIRVEGMHGAIAVAY